MNVFNKSIVDISDINNLVSNKIPESRNLEYKLVIPPITESGNKEFLKDVSAFANTMGGYLIYGIQEEKGVPVNIEGVLIPDFDKLQLHFENVRKLL